MRKLISELVPASDYIALQKQHPSFKDSNKVSKTAKLNLTKLLAEAMRLEGKSKSNLASPSKSRRVKIARCLSYKKVDTS